MSGLKRLNPTPRFWDQTPLEPGVSLEPRLVARRWVRQRKVFWGVLARCAHSFSQRTLATGTEKMPLCIPAGQAVTSIRGNLESSGSSHKGAHSRRGGKSRFLPQTPGQITLGNPLSVVKGARVCGIGLWRLFGQNQAIRDLLASLTMIACVKALFGRSMRVCLACFDAPLDVGLGWRRCRRGDVPGIAVKVTHA